METETEGICGCSLFIAPFISNTVKRAAIRPKKRRERAHTHFVHVQLVRVTTSSARNEKPNLLCGESIFQRHP